MRKLYRRIVGWVGALFRSSFGTPAAQPLAAPAPLPPPPVRDEFPSYVAPKLPLSPALDLHPIVDARALLAYWKRVCSVVDLNALSKDKNSNDYIESLELAQVRDRGRDDHAAPDREAGEADDLGLIAITSVCRGTAYLLAVPVMLRRRRGQQVRFTAVPPYVPVVNPHFLSPASHGYDFTLCARADFERLASAFGHTHPSDIDVRWETYWDDVVTFLCHLVEADDEQQMREKIAASRQDAGRHRYTHELVATVFKHSNGATEAIERYYEHLAAAETAQFDLIRTIAGRPAGEPLRHLSRPSLLVDHWGHMDEMASDERRAHFALDESQRAAVGAALNVGQGELVVLNGPPGSGKTSLLRSLIASLWVKAALGDVNGRPLPCPIVLAVGGTDQSVRNVIGAFGDAPQRGDAFPLASRWIPGVTSYGAYAPAQWRLKDVEERKKMSRYVLLAERMVGGNIFSFSVEGNALDPFDCFRFPEISNAFLTAANAVLGGSHSHEQVQHKCHRNLAAAAEELNLVRRAADPLTQKTKALLAEREKLWTDRRRKDFDRIVSALGDPRADRQLLVEELLDHTWRLELFYWAAHYWEATFILEQERLLFSRTPENVERALRRVCMLTPCIVSTFHSLPRLLAIDPHAIGPSQPHVLAGIADFLIIDEAGQASPNLAGPALACARRAAIVGDRFQLAPVATLSTTTDIELAREAGIVDYRSIAVTSRHSTGSVLQMCAPFSRWHDGGISPGVMLRYHYRCAPTIIEYCNQKLDYHGTLIPRTNDESALTLPHMGWVEVEGREQPCGKSWTNPEEQAEIVEWIERQWPYWRDHDPSTVGKPIQNVVAVLSAYKQQANQLKERLQARLNKLHAESPRDWPDKHDVERIIIGTVHALQGAECPYVCFSLVEDGTHDGVLIDNALMNVAVSRAKKGFIIFANPRRLFGPTGSQCPAHLLGEYLLEKCGATAWRVSPRSLMVLEGTGKMDALKSILGREYKMLQTGGAFLKIPLAGGVDIANGFSPLYEMEPKAESLIRDIEQELKRGYRDLIVATDDDTMGEYIGWQLVRLLRKRGNALPEIKRLRLAAITSDAVRARLAQARPDFDSGLICAAAAREVMDVCFTNQISQALHSGGVYQSIGRVQAAILRLVQELSGNAGQRRFVPVIEFSWNGQRRTLYGEFTAGGMSEPGPVLLNDLKVQDTIFDVKPRAATTLEILAQAADRYKPWDAVKALQELYDGRWKPQGVSFGGKLPVKESSVDQHGHPPVHPLFEDAEPAAIEKITTKVHADLYAVVWTLHHSQSLELKARRLQIDSRVTSLAGQALGSARFTVMSLTGDALPPDAAHVSLRDGICAEPDADTLAARLLQQPWNAEVRLVGGHTQELRAHLLLRALEANKIGKASTVPGALERLCGEKGLLRWENGLVSLTDDGRIVADALQRHAAKLSEPIFSLVMGQRLESVEAGGSPADVLIEFASDMGAEGSEETLRQHAWRNVDELAERARDAAAGERDLLTPLVSKHE